MTSNLILSPELEPEEIAEVLVRDCGIEKSQRIMGALGMELKKVVGTVDEAPRCRSCEGVVKGDSDTRLCSACGGK